MFLGGTNRTIADFFEKFFTLSKPFQTRAPYTYNEATTIAQTYIYVKPIKPRTMEVLTIKGSGGKAIDPVGVLLSLGYFG